MRDRCATSTPVPGRAIQARNAFGLKAVEVVRRFRCHLKIDSWSSARTEVRLDSSPRSLNSCGSLKRSNNCGRNRSCKTYFHYGGENIAPREIDDVMYQFPGILEAAAIGIADDNYGEEISACLVPSPGVVRRQK